MRKTLQLWALVLVVGAASTTRASASFSNRNIGLGVTGLALLGDKRAMATDWLVPLTLEGGQYLESGFELLLRASFFFAQQRYGVTPPPEDGPGTVIGGGGWFGVRYLILEESIRPYVDLHLAGLYFNRDAMRFNNFFIGPGVGGGCDFFITESVSLGVRGVVDMFITLNQPLSFAVGGGAYVTIYL